MCVNNKYRSQVSLEVRNQYILFRFNGEDSLKDSIYCWTQVGEQCRKLNYKKALIVENLRGGLNTSEAYILTMQLPKLIGDIKTAFVDLQIDNYHENSFGETVAINHGINTKVFMDTLQAEKWLLQD